MRSAAMVLLAIALAACAAVSAAQGSAPAAPATTAASMAQEPAGSSDPSHPDRSCKVDADCQVKNVGNCCGAYPECVNKNASTDPAKVRAQCASSHMMGTCHVMAISGCSCVQGQCADNNSASAIRTH